MKKFLLVLVAVFGLGLAANAQNWIGVRGAFGSSSGAELSFQHGFNANNRLELDLGWSKHQTYGFFNLSAVYQWMGGIAGNLGWFAGVGANAGIWNGYSEGNFGLGFLAQAGLEYNFQAVPFQITLDFRPQWDVLGAASGFGYAGALGIRYRW